MSAAPSNLERAEIARRISSFERGQGVAGVASSKPLGPSRLIGVTGVPGSGKSTLVNALVAVYRNTSERVAVIAVDPSSPVSGGALLGDRVRMTQHSADDGVFIRSMGSRGRIDGLGPAVQDSCRLLASRGYDPVIVETVGVGQVELGVVECSDIRVLVLAPAWGDYVQATKAGLIEMVDLVVVNKADLPGAANLLRDIREELRHRKGKPVNVVASTATQGAAGIAAVSDGIETIWQRFDERALRCRRVAALVSDMISRAVAAFSAGALQDTLDEGIAQKLAESVHDGRTTPAEAAQTLLWHAVRCAQVEAFGQSQKLPDID